MRSCACALAFEGEIGATNILVFIDLPVNPT
jgi:hypothetical protein